MSDRYLRVHEVAQMLSINKSTVWAWNKKGDFPKGIKLSERVTVWRLSEIVAYTPPSTLLNMNKSEL